MSALTQLVYLSTKTAQNKSPLLATATYNKRRQEIYKSMQRRKLDEYFNQDFFNTIENGKELLEKTLQELQNLEDREINPSAQIPNAIFDGTNDNVEIQRLIKIASDLRGVKSFDQFAELLKSMQETSEFCEKIKSKASSNVIQSGNINLFSFSTSDYNKLLDVYKQARDLKNIEMVRQAARIYFSGLLGNLGEAIGVIAGYNFVSKELRESLKASGIEVSALNTGGKTHNRKRTVGDTTIEFKYNGTDEIVGLISISNKLTANYGNVKPKHIKIRTTSPTRIEDFKLQILYYNLYALHYNPETKQSLVDLYPNKNKDKMAFRRYLAATILQKSLYGVGSGDEVYYFNYGSYIFTMNQLLESWIDNVMVTEVPVASLPGYNTRLNMFKNNWTDIKEVEQLINRTSLIISFNFRLGNLRKALG